MVRIAEFWDRKEPEVARPPPPAAVDDFPLPDFATMHVESEAAAAESPAKSMAESPADFGAVRGDPAGAAEPGRWPVSEKELVGDRFHDLRREAEDITDS